MNDEAAEAIALVCRFQSSCNQLAEKLLNALAVSNATFSTDFTKSPTQGATPLSSCATIVQKIHISRRQKTITFKLFRPSHFLLRSGSQESAGADSSCHRVTSRQFIAGPRRQTKTNIHSVNLALPFHFTSMFSDCGRKLEKPERAHTDTERTCKLHTEGPRHGFDTTAFLL